MCRFLLSRQLDVDKAFEFWEGWVEWRREHKPEAIERVHVEPQLAVQVVNVRGFTPWLVWCSIGGDRVVL